MKIIINGIEPQFKIYKMLDTINNKVYIGSTFYPLKARMGTHKNSKAKVDEYFSNVGWDNVIVEIIDTANDINEMKIKENEYIERSKLNNSVNLLNKNKAYTGLNRKDYGKYHYQTNRDYYKKYFTTKIICDTCHACFQKSGISHHQKTKKHIKFLSGNDLV